MGVENAAFVCCFLTSDYEQSDICRLELQYASKRRKQIIPLVLDNESFMNRVAWLEPILGKLLRIDLRDTSESKFRLKTREILHRINDHATISQQAQLHSIGPPTYLWELIKYEYMRNSSIERFINPAKSFPIEQSYINLAIVKSKEHQDQEKELRTAVNRDAIIDTYEDIYGSKTSIEIQDIFKSCQDSKRQVLVFGRAGIGKSTFCRYIAHQWAIGKILMEYDLVALIPLRSLTEHRYPPSATYSPCDILITQCLRNFPLLEREQGILKQQLRNGRILWLLDAYDERALNPLPHLQDIFQQLLNTSDHIITSRPFQNTLSRRVHLEITGFTDENIHYYVEQFFNAAHNELQSAPVNVEKLIPFLKSNPRLWGIAHIPINLELICSVWSNNDWSGSKTMTTTMLYDKVVEWMCRRYLEKHHGFSSEKLNAIRKKQLYKECTVELNFLERLAFLAMVKNTIILRPKLLEQAEDESGCSTAEHPNLLNIGILKSFSQVGTGTQIEVDKDHYFVHLSFQEYFAARYLVNDFKHSNGHEAIKFIQDHKYELRLRYVLTFTSGLLADDGNEQCIDLFWDTIMSHPIDLVGIQHMNLMLTCFDETGCRATTTHQQQLIPLITHLIEKVFKIQNDILSSTLLQSLKSCTAILHHPHIQQTLAEIFMELPQTNIVALMSFINTIVLVDPLPALRQAIVSLLSHKEPEIRRYTVNSAATFSKQTMTKSSLYYFVAALGHKNSVIKANEFEALTNLGEEAAALEVIVRLLSALADADAWVRCRACEALGMMGERAANPEVVDGLITALYDENSWVRRRASEALGMMGERAANPEVVDGLMKALRDKDYVVRRAACEALGMMGERAANPEVVDGLITALYDENIWVRIRACEALGMMGERAAISKVIDGLMAALHDEETWVRCSACEALGEMGERAANPEVVDGLITALYDENIWVRSRASKALGMMGERAANPEVVDGLMKALRDKDYVVRRAACEALGEMGERAAIPKVIDGLMAALRDKDYVVRCSACVALGGMGERAAIPKVIDGLMAALHDEEKWVRCSAFEALGKMGERPAIPKVIDELMAALHDEEKWVRCSAFEALGKMGERAAIPKVIDELMAALHDKDYVVRRAAFEALGEMGERAAISKVIDGLMAALHDEEKWVRRSACVALGKMGERAAIPKVIDELMAAVHDEDIWVRRSACVALGEMGERAAIPKVIDELMAALHDEDKDVRCSACDALGEMGERAAIPKVIDELMAALHDENDWIRRRVFEALAKLSEIVAMPTVIDRPVIALDAEIAIEDVSCYAWEAPGFSNETVAGAYETARGQPTESELCGAKRFKRNDHSSNRLETSTGGAALYSPVREEYAGGIDLLWTEVAEWPASEKILRAFSRSHNSSWLLASIAALLYEENACYLVGEKVVIVCRRKSVQIRIRDKEIRENLRAALSEQKNKLFGRNHIEWKSSEQERSRTKESMIVD